ncbi:hypothetical protein MLD52_10380 [Puniceicoccaceae bacterium K14]|nr:hypothetical protein [Puniceicoccaceae bacterium K14]
MNKWRSPTAEKIYENHPYLSTRSAGTSSKARHSITLSDIKWSDFICVMESKHKQRLKADFPVEMQYKETYVLEIEDNYTFMDPELVKELKITIDPIIKEWLSDV